MRLSKILWFVSGVQVNIIIYWSQKLMQMIELWDSYL